MTLKNTSDFFYRSLCLSYSINIILYHWLCFPGGSAGKESACNAEDLGSIPGLGRYPGGGNGYPLQCSDLGLKEADTTEWVSVCKYLISLARL